MAHQPEVIPWRKLAAHLKACPRPEPKEKSSFGRTPAKLDLKYRGDTNEEDDVDTFRKSFIKAVQEAARFERAKYPPKYESPRDDEVVIPDGVARKMTPWVRRWRAEIYTSSDLEALLRTEAETKRLDEKGKRDKERARRLYEARRRGVINDVGLLDDNTEVEEEEDEEEEEKVNEIMQERNGTLRKEVVHSSHSSDKLKGGFKWDALCEHNVEFQCGCALPFQERTAAAFMRKYKSNRCYKFLDKNASGFFNAEITKTLIVLGDLEPVLRICAKSDNNMLDWHRVYECGCCGDTEGWSMIYEAAFHSYLMLNVFYCLPELWQSSANKNATETLTESDIKLNYRSTESYQKMVDECIDEYCTWMVNFSHRELYQHRYFRDYADMDGPFDEEHTQSDAVRFRSLFSIFSDEAPIADDVVEAVQEVCRKNRVPEELCLTILEYTLMPKMRLAVPYDPLHPRNYDELVRYLEECWAVMVRCQVVGMEAGINLGWESMFHWKSFPWRTEGWK